MPNPVLHAKRWLGVVLKEWPRYRRCLGARDDSYLTLCNRNERLQAAPNGAGFRCDWRWTSDLHAPKYMPSLGRRLMARSLTDHPIRRAAGPSGGQGTPELSFIIGHRGIERLPHLLATLESIAGQDIAAVECVVVEQDVESRIAPELPSWVRHVLTPPPEPGMPYCRSWTFNIGVKHAAGAIVVLHDNDMLVPADYAQAILRHVRAGHEVVNLKRFIYYLGEAHTRGVFAGTAGLTDFAPLAIVQNLEAGGSIAITRAAYDRIGGMDESFIGWGGEDNEFWDRAQTLAVWPYAYLPIVHLWHAAQPGKHRPGYPTLQRYRDLSEIPAEVRIETLRRSGGGMLSGPAGWRP